MKRLALMFNKILFAAAIAVAGTQLFANDIETVRMDLGTPFEYSDGLWVHNFVLDVRRTSNFAELVGEAAAGSAGGLGLAGERIPVQGSCIERRGWYCRVYLGNGVEFRYMENGQYTATDSGGFRVSGTAEISFYVRNRLNTPFNMGGLVTFVDGGDNSGIPGNGGNNSSDGGTTGSTVTYYSITNPGNGQSTTATLPDNIFAGTYWQWRNAAGDSDWSALASDDPDAAAQGRTLTIQSENSYQYRISWESGGTRKFASTFVTSNSAGNDNGTAGAPLDCGNLHSGDCRVLSLLYDHWNLSRIGWGAGDDAGQWPGVTVTNQRVVRLDFYGRQLTGPIPTYLGQLDNLLWLVLSENNLTGGIPGELGQLRNLDGLNLSNNQLTGGIPPSLGQLTNLEQLWLGGNKLTGEIPPVLGRLSNLQYLYLHENQLTGGIPAELGQLTNLVVLDLDPNPLTGEIPESVRELCANVGVSCFFPDNNLVPSPPLDCGDLNSGDCDVLSLLYDHWDLSRIGWGVLDDAGQWEGVTVQGSPGAQGDRVTRLSLTSLELTGGIPVELGQLTSLESLLLSDNQLTGGIPAELGQLANLKTLWLGGNQLTEIPTELGDLTNLMQLLLSDNQLTEIPTELGQLANLDTLWLGRNQLTEIPTELGRLQNLKSLTIYGNQLTGQIPMALGQLSNLQYLDLTDNQLTGEIPSVLGRLINLEWLALGGNELTGRIPPELGQLTNLEFLILYRNQLTGEIPMALGQLRNLEGLELHVNQLTGRIPAELGQLANLRGLSLYNNQLTGEIPEAVRELCDKEGVACRFEGNNLTE